MSGYQYRDPKRTADGSAWRQSLVKLHTESVIVDPVVLQEWAVYTDGNVRAMLAYDHLMYVEEANDIRRANGGPTKWPR
jgi:hypothetical protein